MDDRYETIISVYTILPIGQSIYSEMATTVELDDEGAGLFVAVKQAGRTDSSITFDNEEWPQVKRAIDLLLFECKQRNKQETP